MQFPVWCACGKLVVYSNETRCEDCWAADQDKIKTNPADKYEKHYLAPIKAILARRLENDSAVRSKLLRSSRH